MFQALQVLLLLFLMNEVHFRKLSGPQENSRAYSSAEYGEGDEGDD
jgi:hypothetical protein